MNWVFEKRPRSQVLKDPIQGEFFNTDSIEDGISALVREAVQNSLDAAERSERVTVRFFVSGDDGALDPGRSSRWLTGIWSHRAASMAESRQQGDDLEGQPCRYLVVEDFGTSGLTGDVEACDPPPAGAGNNFFYFFRAEGRSGKGGADNGRWGVGKYVFPKMSDINSFFALTRRDGEDLTMLMGRSIMANHQLATGERFLPDGWFAEWEDDLPVPSVDLGVVGEFSGDWSVSRTDEPGLSLVIPFVGDLAADQVVRKVVEEYAPAILDGRLEAVVEGGDGSRCEITDESIRSVIEASWGPGADRSRVLTLVDLLARANDATTEEVVTLPAVSGRPVWSPEILGDASEELIERLDRTGFVCVKVPVEVGFQSSFRSRISEDVSVMEVIFLHDDHASAPDFIRQGIRIPAVRSPQIARFRSAVRVSDGTLASLLGDAEGPAHTDWNANRDKLKGKYQYTRELIDFVKRAPKAILDAAQGQDEDEDRSITAAWFPDPVGGDERRGKGAADSGDSEAGSTDRKVGPKPPSRRRVTSAKVAGGFSVGLNELGLEVKYVEVKVAYDVRRGNALSRWSADDFTLDDLTIDVIGGSRFSGDGNRIVFLVDDPKTFRAQVTGFDEHRDVFFEARTGEGEK